MFRRVKVLEVVGERKESKARLEQGRRKVGRGHWDRRGVHNRSRFYPVCYFCVFLSVFTKMKLSGTRNLPPPPPPPPRLLPMRWVLLGI